MGYLIWCGMVWYGMVWYGSSAWHIHQMGPPPRLGCLGMCIRFGGWYGMVWCFICMVWYGVVWCGVVRCGVELLNVGQCRSVRTRTTEQQRALLEQQRTVGGSEQQQQALASSTQHRIYVVCRSRVFMAPNHAGQSMP